MHAYYTVLSYAHMDALLLSGDLGQNLASQFGVSVGVITVAFLLIAAWSLTWKGIALWFAARNYQKRWFIAMIVINNTLGLLEIVYLIWFRRDRRPGVTQSLFNNPVQKDQVEAIDSSR